MKEVFNAVKKGYTVTVTFHDYEQKDAIAMFVTLQGNESTCSMSKIFYKMPYITLEAVVETFVRDCMDRIECTLDMDKVKGTLNG